MKFVENEGRQQQYDRTILTTYSSQVLVFRLISFRHRSPPSYFLLTCPIKIEAKFKIVHYFQRYSTTRWVLEGISNFSAQLRVCFISRFRSVNLFLLCVCKICLYISNVLPSALSELSANCAVLSLDVAPIYGLIFRPPMISWSRWCEKD